MKESILISIIIIIIYIFILINRNNSTYIKSNTGAKFLIHKDNKKQEKSCPVLDTEQLYEKLFVPFCAGRYHPILS